MIAIRPLVSDDLARADAVLPLHRLDETGSGYLVAWDGDEPVGHVRVDWADPPELQDLWVVVERRSRGIGRALIAAAERAASERGCNRLRIAVGLGNDRALRIYERLGYLRTDTPPRRVEAQIVLRGKSLDVDDTLVELEKPLR